MDSDGMTLVDGSSGRPIANKFFSTGTSQQVHGGARTRSSVWMAEQVECMVIKISEDSKGEIAIYRGCAGSEPDTRTWPQHSILTVALDVTGVREFGAQLSVTGPVWK